MEIEEVIRTVNQMKADGVIYLEPVSTLGVDIFIELHAAPRSVLVTLDPIFSYLHVLISGWPVQFLPAAGSLIEEAAERAVEIDVAGTPVGVFTAEHIAAIALQTGRAKDKARLLQFVETGVLDKVKFEALIDRHGLIEKWRQFQQQFLRDE